MFYAKTSLSPNHKCSVETGLLEYRSLVIEPFRIRVDRREKKLPHSPKPPTLESTQHIWPTFLAALILGLLGFGLALQSAPLELPTQNVNTKLSNLTVESPSSFFDTQGQTKAIAKTAQSSVIHAFFRQEITTQGAHTNTTLLSFDIIDKKQSEHLVHRTFENVAVEIHADENTLAAPVSFDVAQLIQTAKYEIKFLDNGTQKQTLISSDPGRLSRVLRFIVAALAMSDPALPSELQAHQSWDEESPLKDTPEFAKTRTITRTYSGSDAHSIAIHTSLTSDVITKPRKKITPLPAANIHTEGKGTSILQRNDGALFQSEMHIVTTTTFEQDNIVSKFTIKLKKEIKSAK